MIVKSIELDSKHYPGQCDHLAVSGEGWTHCIACGSRCERDKKGVIVGYARHGLPTYTTTKVEGDVK